MQDLPNGRTTGLVNVCLISPSLQPRIRIDPVRLPCLATIFGKRLLRSPLVRGGSHEQKPHQDHLSVERFLIIELSSPALEISKHRSVQRPACYVREIQAPLMRLRIVQSQREKLDVLSIAIDLDLRQVDRKSTRLNSSHIPLSRMPSSA